MTGSSGNACFSASKITNQGISTAVVLEFETGIIDVGDYHDISTYWWIPPAGVYEITLSCQFVTSNAQSPLGSGGEILYISEGSVGQRRDLQNGTIVVSGRAEIWQSASNHAYVIGVLPVSPDRSAILI